LWIEHPTRYDHLMDSNRFPLAACRRLELAPGHRPVLAEIDLVSSDPDVLPRIAGRNRKGGRLPGPTAPGWRMDDARDRFLTAFTTGATASRGAPR
jgi:hypothetical protein